MSDEGNVRAMIFRGDESLRVVVRVAPDGRSYVELGKYSAAGARAASVNIRPDELDRIVEGLRDARNVTLGHPKHDTGESAIGEIAKLRKAAG